jgi:hypothetical protein
MLLWKLWRRGAATSQVRPPWQCNWWRKINKNINHGALHGVMGSDGMT